MFRIVELKPPIKCVSIVDDDYETAEHTADFAFEKGADALEIRADFFKNPIEVIELVKIGIDKHKPMIYTCMSKADGGKYVGNEEKRIELLEEASNNLIVSLEYDFVPTTVNKRVMDKGGEVISTYHKYDGVLYLDQITSLAKAMERHSDIVKIVSSPQTRNELREYIRYTLWMQENLQKPFISLAMGPYSRPWRYGAFELGSILGFFAIDEKRKARPEQPTLEDANLVLERFYPKKQ